MSDANATRGEVELSLGGQSYVLRPSYDAIRKIEAATGAAVSQLAMLAEGLALQLDPLKIIVAEMIRAWGEETGSKSIAAADPDKIGKMIMAEGIMSVTPTVGVVLGLAASGGYEPSGKPKASLENGTETPKGA